MATVSEIARVLKPNGLATIVFHSAKSEVWRSLVKAYSDALTVKATSVLDKLQTSFKQTVSDISAKGDPLLLLSKNARVASHTPPKSVISEMMQMRTTRGRGTRTSTVVFPIRFTMPRVRTGC